MDIDWKAALADAQPRMLEHITSLVLENSYTENIAGGNRVGALLCELASGIPGLSTQSFSSERFATHWMFSSPPASASAAGSVVLIGHLDTVFPAGSFEGFRVEGGLARGPGVLDMKGGLVVVFEALRTLSALGLLPRIGVRFMVVSDEEVGSPEGRALIQREALGASCALAFEAGRKADAIIVARKGTGGIKAKFFGKAAHAGNGHQQGVNAIWALSKFVESAQSLTDYEAGITVNVGKVTGGQGKNTVPDFAEAATDFRFLRTEDGERLALALAEAAEQAARAVSGARAEVEGGVARTPLERTPENVAICREYATCAEKAGLGCSEAPLVAGGSDASSTAAIGVPSIDGLGPRGTGFHTKEELIEVDSLVPKVEALCRFLSGRRV